MMKIIFLTLIVASVSVSAYPVVKTWTFNELSDAIEKEDPFVANEDPEQNPLGYAFNFIMYALYTGEEESVFAFVISPTGSKVWTMDQLKQVLDETHADPYLLPFIAQAYESLMYENSNEEGYKETTEVRIPAVDISTWTLRDVLMALKDPQTDRKLIPYLLKAQKRFEEAEDKGQKKENVILVTPVGLVPRADGVIPTIVQRSNIDEHNNLVK